MAGDWIKMRTDLYRDPKVIAIANHLLDENSDLSRYVNQNAQCDMCVTRNVMRNAVVGALVNVWGVMRHQGRRDGADLVMPGYDVAVVDDIADMQGFGEAMASGGWLLIDDDGLRFPKFFAENNSDPKEDQNAKNAERQRRYREAKRAESNVTRNVTCSAESNARIEKNREEKSITETQCADAQVVSVSPKPDAAAVNAPAKRASFSRPSVQEIIDYVLEIRATVDAKVFWDYYESNGWKVGRNAMKDWRATVRQWHSRNHQGNGNGHNQPRLTAAQHRENANASAFDSIRAAIAASSE